MDNISEISKRIEEIRTEVKKVLVGQDEMFEALLISLFSEGHVLLEGAPGLAKTLTVRTFAKVLGLPYKRIQFTPDLLPADIVGTEIYNEKKQDFSTSFGPVFSNFVLADEINRAPSKVQSALLEAMQEKQVTIGKQTFDLPQPFLVLATQNPIEQEGTYQLPEAQIDRFLMKVSISYPNAVEEFKILEKVVMSEKVDVSPIVSHEEVLKMIAFTKKVHIEPQILKYIVNLNILTRTLGDFSQLSDLEKYVEYGSSPRGAISLATIAKARAVLNGRVYVTIEDVVDSAKYALGHRIILSYEAIAEGIQSQFIISRMLEELPKPTVEYETN